MDCTKIVKEYILHIGKDVVFTDDLPLKWSCVGILGEEGKIDLKFSLLGVDPGIEKEEVVTYVIINGKYVEMSSISKGFAFQRIRTPEEERVEHWKPLMDANKVLGCCEVKKDITFSVNAPKCEHQSFKNEFKIKFTLIIPKKHSLPFSGYDFTEKNVDQDQTLVVGRQKFYVNKAVLSHYSPFFNTLFHNESFEESKKDEIELKDLDAKEFEVLLQIIHPTTITVNVEKVEFLWKLADRFGIISVAQMCESFICNLEGKKTGAFSFANRMKMAQIYNSDKLMVLLLEEMEKL